ncbi:MAG: nuclear transport factor 2 family protein [Burkholderiales bacterium]
MAADLVYTISKIDIVGTIASVRIELDNWKGSRFTDFLNVLKVNGKWQVMNKVFYLHP